MKLTLCGRRRNRVLAPVGNDLSIGVQEWAGTHEERPGAPFYQSRNCALDLLSAAYSQHQQLLPYALRSSFQLFVLRLGLRCAWLNNNADFRGIGYDLAQQIQPLRPYRPRKEIHASDVPTWSVQACDETFLNGITTSCKNNGDGLSRRLRSQCCNVVAKDYANLAGY